MESYRAGDLTFDVTDAGPPDGEIIVLLHGFPETRASWSDVIPHLTEAGYRVLAPDQRGYSPGARPRGRRAYRLDYLADDIIALADAAGAEKVHVVGHDWGAGVAWAVAADHPDRVHSVTSMATPHPRAMVRAIATSSQSLKSWYMVLFQLPFLPELSFGPAQASMRRSLRKSGLLDDRIDDYFAVLTQPGAATGALNWYRALPFGPQPMTGTILVPALYIYGTSDFALGRTAADLTARYVAGPYRYEVLDGVSHWIPEEVPETVAELVIDHARRYGGHAG